MMYGKAYAVALTLAGGLGLATVAEAAPSSAVPLAGAGMVQNAAFGCGPGLHPDPWGFCRPNGGWWRPRFYHPGWGYGWPRPYGFYGPRRFD